MYIDAILIYCCIVIPLFSNYNVNIRAQRIVTGIIRVIFIEHSIDSIKYDITQYQCRRLFIERFIYQYFNNSRMMTRVYKFYYFIGLYLNYP